MTPGARLRAAIDLLDEVGHPARPADRALSLYTRKRRYMGSKDRAAVRERLYGVLRRRARLDWWLGRAAPAGPAPDARRRVIADLMLHDCWDAAALAAAFDGGQYRPEVLTGEEAAMAAALAGCPLDAPEQPEDARLEVPAWLAPALLPLGGHEVAALNEPAPLTLRVNTLKTDREGARAALAAGGVAAEPAALSPVGLRVVGRPALESHAAYRDGLVEVQDEGSQLAALLVDARPGMTVVDFCAGAGGKTLALAAALGGEGRILACDSDGERLRRMAPRLRRAGVAGVEWHVFADGDDPWLGDHAGAADRVLVDAPCSGSGTWRRAPEARWQLTEEVLAAGIAAGRAILGRAAGLVRPGGRLVYVTCSLLARENAEQVAWLVAAHPAFALLPMGAVWAEAVGGPYPGEGAGPTLTLTPARHGTDGFFVAVAERRS